MVCSFPPTPFLQFSVLFVNICFLPVSCKSFRNCLRKVYVCMYVYECACVCHMYMCAHAHTLIILTKMKSEHTLYLILYLENYSQ